MSADTPLLNMKAETTMVPFNWVRQGQDFVGILLTFQYSNPITLFYRKRKPMRHECAKMTLTLTSVYNDGGKPVLPGKINHTHRGNRPMTVTGGNQYCSGKRYLTRHGYIPMTVTGENRYCPGKEILRVTGISQWQWGGETGIAWEKRPCASRVYTNDRDGRKPVFTGNESYTSQV